jgi:hypothetical protein
MQSRVARTDEEDGKLETAMANEQSEFRTDLSLWCTRVAAAHYTEKKTCRDDTKPRLIKPHPH